ncbi:MAG: ribonuclease [Butyrivibrio sp.]|nr:ribonuclease [Butyrivibrio sp.]
MENLIANITMILTVIGVLAFVVSVITQVTKGWGFLNRIPTAIQVYVTSLVISVLGIVIYLQVKGFKIVWYYIVGAVVLSFFIAFVSTYGWDQLKELWNRSKFKEEGDE